MSLPKEPIETPPFQQKASEGELQKQIRLLFTKDDLLKVVDDAKKEFPISHNSANYGSKEAEYIDVAYQRLKWFWKWFG